MIRLSNPAVCGSRRAQTAEQRVDVDADSADNAELPRNTCRSRAAFVACRHVEFWRVSVHVSSRGFGGVNMSYVAGGVHRAP